MRGLRFSEDLRWAIVRSEYHGLNTTELSALTGVSERQIRRIRECYHQTGDVRTVHDQWGTETRGRNSIVTIEHRHVRHIPLFVDTLLIAHLVH